MLPGRSNLIVSETLSPGELTTVRIYRRSDSVALERPVFGENYLGDEQGIPDWYIVGVADDTEALPWWAPDSYNPDWTVDCDRCATAVSVPKLVTPGRADGEVVDWFCPDCWDDFRDRLSPEWAHAGQPDVHRAEYLDRTVEDNPEIADINELVELTQSDDEKAQMHTLTALDRLIPERIEEIMSVRPILTDQLESDKALTRFGALSCLTMIAEHDPESVLPVVDKISPLLDPSSDDGVLGEGIRFVAAVAEEYPGCTEVSRKLGRITARRDT